MGGTDATQGQFPFQLSWEFSLTGDSYHHFCGASIYDEYTAITAAHCCDLHSDTVLVAGELDLKVDSGKEQVRKVVEERKHAGYKRLTKENDICILKVDEPFVFNEDVAAVDMPEAGEEFTGTVTVSGWGALAWEGAYPDHLQSVDVQLMTDEGKEHIHLLTSSSETIKTPFQSAATPTTAML